MRRLRYGWKLETYLPFGRRLPICSSLDGPGTLVSGDALTTLIRRGLEFGFGADSLTRNINIDTDSWYEFPGDLATTGFFGDQQLTPDIVQRKFTDIVKGYTTCIGYVDQGNVTPRGSGTFVQRRDGQRGILTAGHVVGAIEGRERILISQGIEDLAWIQIEAAGLDGYGKANREQTGPDIGWIPLSAEEARHLEDGRHTVFYNMAKEREEFPRPFSRVGVVLGFLAEMSRPEAKALGFHATFTGKPQELPADADGWDYVEYRLDGDEPALPSTHKGVSGSGVWRMDLPMDGTGRKEVVLVGVAFAEGSPQDRKLRTHGQKSLSMLFDRLVKAGAGHRQ